MRWITVAQGKVIVKSSCDQDKNRFEFNDNPKTSSSWQRHEAEEKHIRSICDLKKFSMQTLVVYMTSYMLHLVCHDFLHLSTTHGCRSPCAPRSKIVPVICSSTSQLFTTCNPVPAWFTAAQGGKFEQGMQERGAQAYADDQAERFHQLCTGPNIARVLVLLGRLNIARYFRRPSRYTNRKQRGAGSLLVRVCMSS